MLYYIVDLAGRILSEARGYKAADRAMRRLHGTVIRVPAGTFRRRSRRGFVVCRRPRS